MTDRATLATALEDGVLTVHLDRPERLNALDTAMRAELADLWDAVADDPQVRVVVVTGRGRAFCAGADTADLPGGAPRVPGPPARDLVPSPRVEVPVLVAVNGPCIGGGLRLVAHADIVLAGESAWFSDPHVSLGQTSGPCALGLAAKASAAAVAPLVLAGAGHRMDAREAREVGLVSEVLADPDLLPRARELARAIAAQSPTAVRRTVAVLRAQVRAAAGDGWDAAWAAIDEMWTHPDGAEARAARSEGRAPVWAAPTPVRGSSPREEDNDD
jgi:enoyl-CoA hydratase/carnithine racemase